MQLLQILSHQLQIQEQGRKGSVNPKSIQGLPFRYFFDLEEAWFIQINSVILAGKSVNVNQAPTGILEKNNIVA